MTRRDPSKWESSVRRPDDFDEYWRQTEADTLAVPLNPRLEPVPMRSTPEVEVFEARYDSYAGLEIAGWYCRPRKIDGQLCPATSSFPDTSASPNCRLTWR